MPSLLTILGICGFAITILTLCLGMWQARRAEKLPQKSTKELKAILADPSKNIFVLRALDELKTRGEDLSCGRPAVARMLASSHKGIRYFGFLAAQTYFSEFLERFDYNWRRPSEQAIAWLQVVAAEGEPGE